MQLPGSQDFGRGPSCTPWTARSLPWLFQGLWSAPASELGSLVPSRLCLKHTEKSIVPASELALPRAAVRPPLPHWWSLLSSVSRFIVLGCAFCPAEPCSDGGSAATWQGHAFSSLLWPLPPLTPLKGGFPGHVPANGLARAVQAFTGIQHAALPASALHPPPWTHTSGNSLQQHPFPGPKCVSCGCRNKMPRHGCL